MEDQVSDLRSFVRRVLVTLTSSRDGAEIARILQAVKECMGMPDSTEPSLHRQEFLKTHYSRFLQALVNNLQDDWLKSFTVNQQRELLDSFFLDGPSHHVFLVMLDTIAADSPSSLSNGTARCVDMLERFLQEHRLGKLIWEVSQEDEMLQAAREGLLTRIAALPDHVANRLQRRNRPTFYPQNYYPLLGREMLSVLDRVSQQLKGGTDTSFSFVSQLLGKVCVQGHSNAVLDVLVPRLSQLTQSDGVWQRICWRLVEDVPDRWMESVVSGLVRMAAGADELSRLLGSIVTKNKKAEFVLTHKLLLLQYHHKTSVLQSLLGYLARERSQDTLLLKVLRKLLEVWGDRGVVRHAPLQQQAYISCAIVLGVTELGPQLSQEHRAELLCGMMQGVDAHLDSSLPRLRRLGMVVAECVNKQLGPSTHRLAFQYDEDEETREIRSLCSSSWDYPTLPHRNGDCQKDTRQEPAKREAPIHMKREETSSAIHTKRGKTEASINTEQDLESELDSDDDLVPYDQSDDTELTTAPAPLYLNDCLEGLRSAGNPERMDASLKVAETLIRQNPAAAQELAVEFTKILLHLEDVSGIVGFAALRQRAMVALTVTAVLPVTHYLTSEFYAANYSLAQRLDILDVLVLSAQELGEPEARLGAGCPTGQGEEPLHHLQDRQDLAPLHPSQQWRQVVEQRLRSKTRHFSRGGCRPPPKASPNRLGSVLGHFFFPLLNNFDRPQTPYNFLAEQPLMMGRLIHSLAMLMYLSVNTPIAIHMGKALLGFTWALRYHPDMYVRQGTLFAVSSLLLAVPTDRLLAEVADELLEVRCWLADVTEHDPNDDCRRLALQSLRLLENYRKNLGISSE